MNDTVESASVELSLIVPVKNEAVGIDLFLNAVIPVVEEATASWEMIVVDDGSDDPTLQKLTTWRRRDPRIKILSFSRNFGKEAALTAGFDYCRGRAAIPVDADMQDPIHVIPELLAKWRQGYRVVLAGRRDRSRDTRIKRVCAKLFYRVMKAVAKSPIHENVGDFRLLDRVVIEAVRRMPERVRFMKGILSWPGFDAATVWYDRPARAAGRGSWRPGALIGLGLDALFSFSDFPIKLISIFGGLLSACSIVYGIFIVVKTLIYGIDLPGYASLVTILLFASGIQLLSIGILGEYIGRIYIESKKRPMYIVAARLGFEDKPDA